VAWNASRNSIHLPTLSDGLLLYTEIGEIVILVSKTSKSRSIRASSFATGFCFVIEAMIGSMVVMKNTWKRVEMVCNWCIVELQLKNGGRSKV
jgi:hypothetical protein